MEPRIRYTRTTDGVNIAYWALGDGPVLLNVALPSSHIQREWQTPALRAIYEWSARMYRFVRFDHRGVGLSERAIDDFSIDALVRDIEAVVDGLDVVIRERGNVYGGAVNVAARISAMAAPGEVLVSDVVRALGRTSADVTFSDRGVHTLKGVAEAQQLFRVDPK